MIAALLLQAAAGVNGTALGPLPRQALPVRGCAAYLWSEGADKRLVALAATDPAALSVVLEGKSVVLPRLAADGAASFGFAASTRYGEGATTATLDITVQTRADLTGGAVASPGTLRVDRAGQDGIVLPVAGLIACASPAPESR